MKTKEVHPIALIPQCDNCGESPAVLPTQYGMICSDCYDQLEALAEDVNDSTK